MLRGTARQSPQMWLYGTIGADRRKGHHPDVPSRFLTSSSRSKYGNRNGFPPPVTRSATAPVAPAAPPLGRFGSHGTLTAQIDGATVVSLTDAGWSAGQVGIGTSQGTTAQVDNLRITAVTGPPPPPSAGPLIGVGSGRCLDVPSQSHTNGTQSTRHPVSLVSFHAGAHVFVRVVAVGESRLIRGVGCGSIAQGRVSSVIASARSFI